MRAIANGGGHRSAEYWLLLMAVVVGFAMTISTALAIMARRGVNRRVEIVTEMLRLHSAAVDSTVMPAIRSVDVKVEAALERLRRIEDAVGTGE